MSKVKELSEKYKVHPGTLKRFVDGDTSATKKYLEYYLKFWTQYRKEYRINTTYTADKVISIVKDFDKHIDYISNKDIYSEEYRNILNLHKIVDKAVEEKEIKSFKREEHVDVLYEDDHFLFVNVRTFKGSLKYGSNTRWCTSGRGAQSTFNQYTKAGVLCYLIDKKRNVKFAFHKSISRPVTKFDIFDDKDRSISTDAFIESISLLTKNDDMGINFIVMFMMFAEKYKKIKVALDRIESVKEQIKKINIDKLFEDYKFLAGKPDNVAVMAIEEIRNELVTINQKMDKLVMG